MAANNVFASTAVLALVQRSAFTLIHIQLTVFTCEPLCTRAIVASTRNFTTSSSICACVVVALNNVVLTVHTLVAVFAVTRVAIHPVNTRSMCTARVWCTLIDIVFTVHSIESWSAGTREGPWSTLYTGCSVLAWICCTFINVYLAVISLVSSCARALVRVDFVFTSSSISTWISCTFVNVGFAVRSLKFTRTK